jgi:hypothetical protein
MLFNCPHCRGSLQHDAAHAGQQMACPNCGGQFLMPGTAAPLQIPTIVSGRRGPNAPRSVISPPGARPSTWWSDFADFQRYWTGTIVRVIWLVSAALILVAIVMATFDDVKTLKDSGDFYLLPGIRQVILVGILLVIRVSCEAIIVIFNIAETLVEIKEDQKRRAGNTP